MIMSLELTDKGIARGGDKVFHDDDHLGYVTSGTMVPYWKSEADGITAGLTDETEKRAIALALLDGDLGREERMRIEVRGNSVRAAIVPTFLRSEAPPSARPAVHHPPVAEEQPTPGLEVHRKVGDLLDQAIENTVWRQSDCINLIPSEMTPLPMVRALSIMDSAGAGTSGKKNLAFARTLRGIPGCKSCRPDDST